MSDEIKIFRVSVTQLRLGYITVEAATKEEAIQKAQDRASDHDFDREYDADYSIEEIVEESASELPHCIGCGAVIDRLTAQAAVKANLAMGMSTYSLDITCTGCKRGLHIELGPRARVISMRLLGG